MTGKQKRPVLDSGIWSVLTLPFLRRLLKSSQNGQIPEEDIPIFSERHRSAVLYPQLLPYLEKLSAFARNPAENKQPGFVLYILPILFWEIFWAVFGLSMLVAAKLLGPLLAQQFILLLTPGGTPIITNGYVLAALIFIVGLLQTFGLADDVYYFYLTQSVELTLSSAIYIKVSRLSVKSRMVMKFFIQAYPHAKIINLIDQEVKLIGDILQPIITAPTVIQLLLQFYFLYSLIGFYFLASTSVIAALTVISMFLSPIRANAIRTYKKTGTERVAIAREMLQGKSQL